MGTYSGNEDTYNSSIYIFEPADIVLGGLDGTSNKPIKELTDNASYLKKYKGRVIQGSGEPNSSILSDFETDSNNVNNILYLDTLTGAFWKPDDSSGSTWTNIYKSVIMNINGIQINNSGDDTDYFQLKYDDTSNLLTLTDENNNLANVQVGEVIFNRIDGNEIDIAKIADNEILLLYDLDSEPTTALDGDGLFTVKRLEDIDEITITSFELAGVGTNDQWNVTVSSGNISDYISELDYIQIRDIDEDTGEIINGYYYVNLINDGSNYFTTSKDFNQIIGEVNKSGLAGKVSKDNSAIIKWDNTNNYFTLIDRNGNLLPLNCAGFSIDGVSTNFIADRVISSTSQFNNLFANVNTGDTVCYVKTPESNYQNALEDEYVYIKKNSSETDGHYDLNNIVEFIGNNIKVHLAPGAEIKYADNAYFRIRNDTNLTVDSYTANQLKILSEDTQYINGENEDGQVSIVNNDTIFGFSDTENVNQKYTVSAIEKNINENVVNELSLDNATDYDIASYGNEIVYGYISAGEIYVKLYTYNSVTNLYSLTRTVFDTSAGSNTYTNISIDYDGTNVFISASESNALRYDKALSNTSTSRSNLEHQISGTDYDNPRIKAYDGLAYVLAYYDNGTDYLQMFIEDSVDSNSFTATQIDDNTLTTTDYDFIQSESDFIVAYCKNSNLIVKQYNSDFSVENSITTGETNAGYFVRLETTDSSDTGTNDVIIVYNSDIITGGAKDEIKYAEIDTYNYTFENISTALSNQNSIFTKFDIKKNNANLYPTEKSILQIVAFNNVSDITGEYNFNFAYTFLDSISWYTNEFDITNLSNIMIGELYNNYLFLLCDTTQNDLCKYHYQFVIDLNENVDTLSLTDFVISHNYLENIDIDLVINGNRSVIGTQEQFFETDNSIYSKYKLKYKNCLGSSDTTGSFSKGIDGDKKVFNNIYEPNITSNENNDIAFNLSEINHSIIQNSFLEKANDTGIVSKNLNNCQNINFIGFLENESTIGNGDFDE